MLDSLGINSFTINMWAYFEQTNARDIMLGTFNGSNPLSFNFEKNTSNRLRFYWQGIPDISSANDVIPIQQRCMLTLIRDKEQGRIKMFVNGQNVVNQVATASDITSFDNRTLFIGRDIRTTSEATNGKLDDIVFYTTALSDANILDMYQTRAKIDNQGNLYANEFVEASLQEDIITNGLVLHLDASNSQSLNPSNLSTWSDLSGNNINFSLVGSVSYQNNYGGSVKGFGAVTTNYYATTDTSKVSLLPLGNSNRTIFTVIRTPDIYPANHNHIFHYGTPATDQAYGLTLRYNQSASGFVEGLATHPWSGSPTTNVPVPKSKPQTLAATYNSSNSKHNFYIEGALVPSNSDFRALNTVATEARIGMRLSTPAEGLGPTGEIIAILIYDRTLSDSEIKVMHDILKNRYKSGPNSRGQMITREFSEVDSPSQEMKIFKDKIHIQGSLNEGGQ